MAKTAAQLATERKMRKYAAQKNGGKSAAQMATEKKMREAATNAKSAATAAELQRLRDYYKTNGHIPTILSNESKRRFGEADAVDAGELGKQVAAGKITKQQALDLIKQGKAVNDPDALRVGLDVSRELDPEINSRKRKTETGRQALAALLGQDKAATETANKDVAALYAVLQQRMAQNAATINQNYSGAAQAVGDQTAALQKQIQDGYAKANAATQAAVAGAQGGTTQAQTQGGQDAAFLSGLAGIQGAGQQNVLRTGGAGELGVQGQAMNFAQFEGVQTQQQALGEMLRRANEARGNWSAEEAELTGQIGDLEESRFARLYEGKQALVQAREQALQEAEDREYDRRMQESALGIKQYTAETGRYSAESRVAIENAKLAQDAKVQANRHNLEVKRLQLEQSKTNDPLERQLLQAKIDKEKASAVKALSEAAGKSGAGAGKQDRYSQAMNVISTIPNIRPDQVNYLQKLVDSAAARTDYDKAFITSGNQFLMDELNKSGNQNDVTRRYVRQALAILLGVV